MQTSDAENKLIELLNNIIIPGYEALQVVSVAMELFDMAHNSAAEEHKKSHRDTPRATLANQVRSLLEALRAFRTQLEQSLPHLFSEINESPAITDRNERTKAHDLYFYLRYSSTLSTTNIWNEDALSASRLFDAETRGLPAGLKAIETAAQRLIDTRASTRVLSREGRPRDEARQRLGLELALLYALATGKDPTINGEAVLSDPKTDFGKFVAYSAQTHSRVKTFKNREFALFLRNARTAYMKLTESPSKNP